MSLISFHYLQLEHVPKVFHISQLQNFVSDPRHVVKHEPINIAQNLAYEGQLKEILDRVIRQLRNKTIPLVKVLWVNHISSEATWESEEVIRNKYPHVF